MQIGHPSGFLPAPWRSNTANETNLNSSTTTQKHICKCQMHRGKPFTPILTHTIKPKATCIKKLVIHKPTAMTSAHADTGKIKIPLLWTCLKILMLTEFKSLYIAILWPATSESSARSPSTRRRRQGAHVRFKISEEDSLELHEWEWSAGRDEKGVEWVRVLASWSVAFSPGSFQPSAGSAETWSECHLSAYSPAVQPSLTALPGFPGSSCPPAHAQTHVKTH